MSVLQIQQATKSEATLYIAAGILTITAVALSIFALIKGQSFLKETAMWQGFTAFGGITAATMILALVVKARANKRLSQEHVPNTTTLMQWEMIKSEKCEYDDYEFIMKHVASGKEYGFLTRDDKLDLRLKFIQVALLQIPTGLLLRLPYRICDLLSGGFVRRGCKIADREYKNSSYGQLRLIRKIGRISYEFVKDVIKIAAYPIALVGLQFLALFAILDPIDGRHWYASLEEWVAVGDEEEINPNFCANMRFSYRLACTNFLMPCAQPQEVFDRRNLYKTFPEHSPKTVRAQILLLQNRIKDNPAFFQGVDKLLCNKLKEFKARYATLQKKDVDELSAVKQPTCCSAGVYVVDKDVIIDQYQKQIAAATMILEEHLLKNVRALSQSEYVALLREMVEDFQLALAAEIDV